MRGGFPGRGGHIGRGGQHIGQGGHPDQGIQAAYTSLSNTLALNNQTFGEQIRHKLFIILRLTLLKFCFSVTFCSFMFKTRMRVRDLHSRLQ